MRLRALVVDDDPLYRLGLTEMLQARGHHVEAAASGREGIDRGVAWRPDLLVVDWMLKDALHGLHVMDAIAAVRPDTVAILITSFPISDRKAAAARSFDLNAIVAKPFDEAALSSALRTPTPPRRSPGFGVIELDASGVLAWHNPEGARLLGGEPSVGRSLPELSIASAPEAAATAWVPVLGRSAERPLEMQRRALFSDGRRLVLLREVGTRTNEALAETVLGRHERRHQRWPLRGRVLIVDDHAMVRLMSAATLEMAGATCYTAGTHREALRYIEEDPGLEVVVLDYDMPDGDIGPLIRRALERRPELIVIGNSGADNRDNFRERGVDRFIPKPWRIDTLIATVASTAAAPD